MNPVIALTTFPSLDEAKKVTRALLERRLIACANLLPGATSLYRWEGKIAEENEVPAILKTTSEKTESLSAALTELHSYDLPEFLVISEVSGSEGYLDWLRDSVS